MVLIKFFIMFSFPTGQTITPAGMAIMPSSHLYGHTGLIHSAMPILTTATETTNGQLITAGVSPAPGYTAGIVYNVHLVLECNSNHTSLNTESRFTIFTIQLSCSYVYSMLAVQLVGSRDHKLLTYVSWSGFSQCLQGSHHLHYWSDFNFI